MFSRLLIANRGEIALRIMRTARAMGIRSIAVHSDADAGAAHVALADEAFRIGPAPASESYLDQQAILAAARASGAEAVHPGYGFLSENPDFAQAVIDQGLAFVGPSPEAMRLMGLKGEAKRLMREAGLPVVPGYEGEDQSPARLADEARRVGYPVLLKAVAGGGGRGMRRVEGPSDFVGLLSAARREAQSAFGDSRLLVEKHLPAVRHVEVQVMGDRHGSVIHLWERDCSAQRRHQKVIEEAPAPGLPEALRRKMCEAAVAAARRVGYAGAGTVEFLLPLERGDLTGAFFFIEMNTRLQVEHPVTEMITGLDLVELQLRVAAGEPLGLRQEDVPCHGHAVEARLYAEDPAQGFKPQTGRITALEVPEEPQLRFDGGVRRGDHVSAFYDAMIGKLIAHGPTRAAALARVRSGLARTHVAGLVTNVGFLSRLLRAPEVLAAALDTGLIDRNMDSLALPATPHPAAVAAAALAFDGRFDPPQRTSPFHSLRGFSLWGGRERRLWLVHEGEAFTADLAEEEGLFRISSGGETHTWSLVGAELPVVRLAQEGRTISLLCHREEEAVTVVLAEERYRLTRQEASGGEGAGEGGRTVMAPVPGVLAKLMVAQGQAVSAGDLVGIVEAMKTEFTLLAGASGAVTLFAAEGAQVKEGDVIAEIGEANG
ncbi:acetyl/propionyl/methylcrotonyl-CoA carboxylase subunit alpha [Aestuariivirga sp.]|uniref:acetyl/propionyl/methylcrotonyl-CoA carboxylase subunit alpha n=1 Tax=Aestuariivirga sp. TaxID=2650926 RepID=UPI003918D475